MFSWIVRFIEAHPTLHRIALAIWRLFPPRVAGFLKGLLTRNWMVGAVAVMVDVSTTPPDIMLVHHSYRTTGTWGLPGGALESISMNRSAEQDTKSKDNVIEAALRREIFEELGIRINAVDLIRIDAVPYVPEEPGPYRLDFYYRCAPEQGFPELRNDLRTGKIKPRSPEIKEILFVPVTRLGDYDLYSSDARFFREEFAKSSRVNSASYKDVE